MTYENCNFSHSHLFELPTPLSKYFWVSPVFWIKRPGASLYAKYIWKLQGLRRGSWDLKDDPRSLVPVTSVPVNRSHSTLSELSVWNEQTIWQFQNKNLGRAIYFWKLIVTAVANGGGCRGSPKTVKPPKYFRKTVKPSQNSAKTVFTFFHALHVPPRFCAVDECLVIIYMTSNHLWCPKSAGKGEVNRMFTKLYRNGYLFVAFIFNFCDNLTARIRFCEEIWKPLRKKGTVKPSFLLPKTVKPSQKQLETAKPSPLRLPPNGCQGTFKCDKLNYRFFL